MSVEGRRERRNASFFDIARDGGRPFDMGDGGYFIPAVAAYSSMVLSKALIIEFFTYVRRTAMAMRRDVAPFASVLICLRRLSGMYSSAISGTTVRHEVQSTMRMSVSSDPDSKQ